jgi:predicted transcriptional regulator
MRLGATRYVSARFLCFIGTTSLLPGSSLSSASRVRTNVIGQISRVTSMVFSATKLISNVRRTPPMADKPQPVVPIKKSVFTDHIVYLEDGTKLTMLKRHLNGYFNMTSDQYRERWDLPADYPMVAPNYAQHRSLLARKIGLGTNPRTRDK